VTAHDPALEPDDTPPALTRPGVQDRLARLRGESGADLLARAKSSFPARCLGRFGSINGRDRALVLGGQSFTTVIPLLIVVAAAAARKDPTALADRLVTKFHLTGSAAQAIRVLFERPPGSTGTITVVGAVLVLFSLLSLTRSLQRVYEAAWRLPPVGVRGTVHGLTATGVLISSFIVLSLLVGLLRQVPAGGFFSFVVRVVTSTAIWLLLQRLLLSRRVPIRRLLPGSIVAGAGSAVVSLYSALWMPHLIESNSVRYGVIGITFALLTWLIVIAFCVVVVAVISAEMGSASGPERHSRAVASGDETDGDRVRRATLPRGESEPGP
jgi:membrane protein